jgi:hypothetical protein
MRAWLLALASCGSAEIVAPLPVAVLDTSPGNGSVIPPGDQPIVLAFSEDVVSDSIRAAVILEETTPQGTPIRSLSIALDRYDATTFTAVLDTEPFPSATTYRLTVDSDAIRATSGARMLADLVRRFQTR